MIGGAFLCFEGYEKAYQMMVPHDAPATTEDAPSLTNAEAFEEETVAGAIRTDFILSAEIMAISLASIVALNTFMQALVLAGVGLLVTAGVYGMVAIIVKADDVGVYLAQRGGAITRAIGRLTVHFMPTFLNILSFVGTVAMLWVGGGIIIHGLHAYGIEEPEHMVHVIIDTARTCIPSIGDLLAWPIGIITSAVFGLVVGAATALALVPVLSSLWRTVRPA